MRPDNCPHCGVSLIGDPIPENIRQYYSPPYHWRREIGVELRDVYDGILYWKCPDCGEMWNRWPDKPDFHGLHVVAEREMRKEKARRGQA